jgi:5-methylcytosine-specific restriction endonuclease McrA
MNMERILVKIRISQVGYREPYFVECCRCGFIISGSSVEEICKEANERGWKYDYKNDVIYCSDCLTEVLEIEEKIKGEGT